MDWDFMVRCCITRASSILWWHWFPTVDGAIEYGRNGGSMPEHQLMYQWQSSHSLTINNEFLLVLHPILICRRRTKRDALRLLQYMERYPPSSIVLVYARGMVSLQNRWSFILLLQWNEFEYRFVLERNTDTTIIFFLKRRLFSILRNDTWHSRWHC
jgi:hypothetical protein